MIKGVFPILNTEQITKEWDSLVPFFNELVDNHMNLDDIYASLMENRWTLWVHYLDGKITSIAVTTFVYYPRYTSLRIVLLAGAYEDWAYGTEFFEKTAKANYCDTVEILGRKGWERALRSRGFDFQNITLSKRLRDDLI